MGNRSLLRHVVPDVQAQQPHLKVWGSRWRACREELEQWTTVEQSELQDP